MGKCHAIAWNTVGTVFPDVVKPRLVHLGEVDEDLAKRRATEFGFAKASGDWRVVVNDPQVDVVSLTTPNQFHPEMAIAILEAGKHLWCEKPMAPGFAEAQAMAAAARKSGKVAALGYNYIQNPAIRHIGALLDEEAIGEVNHLRIEMDEDFMADPEALFFWKHEAASGYGALDDFAVHPLSLIAVLFGRVARVMCDMAKPYADRRVASGGRRAVETYDIASVLMHLENGIAGTLLVNRSALYDQERMNEFQLYLTSDRPTEQGYRTILVAPHHKPYDAFLPAPGHGLGFNDLKIIECRELLTRLAGKPARIIDFDEGLEIERTVHAMARSFEEKRWVDVR
jgi:predicted dehydrogenase